MQNTWVKKQIRKGETLWRALLCLEKWVGQEWKSEMATWRQRFAYSKSLFVEWTEASLAHNERMVIRRKFSPERNAISFQTPMLSCLLLRRRETSSNGNQKRCFFFVLCFLFSHIRILKNDGNQKYSSPIAIYSKLSKTIYWLWLVHDTADRKLMTISPKNDRQHLSSFFIETRAGHVLRKKKEKKLRNNFELLFSGLRHLAQSRFTSLPSFLGYIEIIGSF